jgi:glyoxylase-like metal-dependent hydrolase (beta-lactamase superfamily II)/8-oxo-dGTP pyrophosphatase MutT (NUDIX family)
MFNAPAHTPPSWDEFRDVTPRKAAAMILYRGESPCEVLMVRRSDNLTFMGGHHAFPGGGIDPQDAITPVRHAETQEQGAALAAAVRELFEETGVLYAEGAETVPIESVAEARAALDKAAMNFADFLNAHGLWIDARRFVPAGRWITPPFSPIRFDSQYFLALAPPNAVPSPLPGDTEIVATEWMEPQTARRRWHRGEIKLSTPVAFILQQLARFRPDEAAPWLQRTPCLREGFAQRYELRCGITLIPVRVHTLPPATHTTCVVVGDRDLYVIDPGCQDTEEQELLLEHLEDMIRRGAHIRGILLTHTHPDHIGAVELLRARYGAPVSAHTAAQDALPFSLDQTVEDGARLTLAGSDSWSIQCLHTPGHDPAHLCFYEETTRTLCCGDLVANPGTIVISPEHKGNMKEYMAGLERILEIPFTLLVPSHGLPLSQREGHEKIKEYLQHRIRREEQIRTAWETGCRTEDALLEQVYQDTPREKWPIARLQLHAHIQALGLTLEN